MQAISKTALTASAIPTSAQATDPLRPLGTLDCWVEWLPLRCRG
jgi:hypothetical protein